MEEELLEILNKRESTKSKKTRIKKTEPKKKKLTKKELQIIEVAKSITLPNNYSLVSTKDQFEALIEKYKTYKETYTDRPYVYLDTETYGVNAFKDPIISISIGFDDNTHYNIPVRPFKHSMSQDVPTLDLNYVADTLRPLLENDYDLVLHNAKFDIHVLYNWMNIDITFNIAWDSMIAAGLLNENHPKGLKEWYLNYALPDLVAKGEVPQDELNKPTFKFGDMFEKIPFDEVPHNLATYYACHDTDMTRAVFKYQKEIFESGAFDLEKVYKLFKEVEMPLIPVLTIAERKGIIVDGPYLKETVGGALNKKLNEIKEEIYKYLGGTITLIKKKTRQKNGIKFKEEIEIDEPLNLDSPSQLAKKLYEEHKILTPVKEYDKTKGQEVLKFKTDRKTLTRNKNTHPVIPLILEYRGLSKLINAFCNTLPEAAKETLDGRIHASYNQLVRTGRMSCSEPNLQQVPAKAYFIRMAFRADEGRMLVSIDFSLRKVG